MGDQNAMHYGQNPLNVVGPKGAHAFIGTDTVFFTGATGLVGTAYGIPGVTCTRVSTGLYQVDYPPCKGANIWAQVRAPTGHSYTANITALNAVSGTAYLHLTRQVAGKLITTGSMPTTYNQPHNPVSGTMVDLMFMFSPSTDTTAY